MSPADGSNLALLENPLGDSFEEAVSDSDDVKAHRRISAYNSAIEARKSAFQSTGIIDRSSKTFLYWDVFLSRSLETAENLAKELKAMFGNSAPDGIDCKAWDKLTNPAKFPGNGPVLIEEGHMKGKFRFDEQFTDGDANSAFMSLMYSKGYKAISIANVVNCHSSLNL